MKPITIHITGHTPKLPREICTTIVETERWSEFKGYSILPGIEKAHFEKQTPELVGSRICVLNTDGSSHIEEIVEWDVENIVVLKFQEFSPPLKYLAAHFIETWAFQCTTSGTTVTRTMEMYPKGILGWLMLTPISFLMRKAFENHLLHLNNP